MSTLLLALLAWMTSSTLATLIHTYRGKDVIRTPSYLVVASAEDGAVTAVPAFATIDQW
jgi:hypothetical protein